MHPPRNPRVWAAAGGLAAAAGAGALAERRHMRRISADPENGVLRDPPSGSEKTVRSADGTALHIELFGDEGATTIVLAHGWTESLQYWIYVIRELAERGFRVAAYDLRGHGDSEAAKDRDYSIPRFGEDLEAVLVGCVPEGRRAVVVGHSLGAMAIASWAEHHEVERLVGAAALLNTGVRDLIREALVLPLPTIAQALNRTITVHGFLGSRAPIPRFSTPIGHAALRYIAFGRAATPAQVAFFERMLVTCPPDVRADVGIAMSDLDLHDVLPKLTVPTLVMAGARDRLTPPSHAKRIAEALPNLVKLKILEDTGHMAPLERPGEIIDAIVELASQVSAPDRAAA